MQAANTAPCCGARTYGVVSKKLFSSKLIVLPFLVILLALASVSSLAFAVPSLYVDRFSVESVTAFHDTVVSITPNIANCEQLGMNYTVNVLNLANSSANIREVRIYRDVDGDGFPEPGIVEFKCGPAPTGWTLDDRTALYNYCQYETTVNGGKMISPGGNKNFTFSATLNSTSMKCGNEFKVSTIDDSQPEGSVVFKKPFVKVDCKKPVITKTVGEPKLPGAGFDWWVTNNTNINLAVSDNQECDLGVDYCRWRVTLDGVAGDWTIKKNGPTLDWNFTFVSDSNHYLEVECYDVAGNKKVLTEMDKVDSTPPVTDKVISDPKKIENGVEWIDTATTITFNPVDPDPTGHQCNIGVDKTWYKNVLAEDNSCWNPAQYCNADVTTPYGNPRTVACINEQQTYCNEHWNNDVNNKTFANWEKCVENYAHGICKVDPEWHLYDGKPINKDQESCHNLYYFSVDDLGNVENTKVNCFFVDETPPYMYKDNGNAIPGSGEGNFTNGGNPNGAFHWINTSMPITFTCDDRGIDGRVPHPSGDEELHFKVSYGYNPDVTYLTEKYCTYYNGKMEGGYCAKDVNPKTKKFVFNFLEESKHNLEYYCEDAVEKKSATHVQYYKVEDTPPIISTEIVGPSYYNITENRTYIDGVTNISVDAFDPEPHPVGGVTCDWDYDVIGGDKIGRGEIGLRPPFLINFPEESQHVLNITCRDKLGNSRKITRTYYVDKTKPVTTKTYTGPQYPNPITPQTYPRWINSQTSITLTVDDAGPHKSGINYTTYRVSLVADSRCDNYDSCLGAQGSGNWLTYRAPFNIPNQSCHLIEYYSVDNVNKTEDVRKQCVFVENTAPVTTKTIGEPKVIRTEGRVCNNQSQNGGNGGGNITPGTNLRQIHGNYSRSCSINTGIAFDGSNLLMTCWEHNVIDVLSPADGALVGTVTVPGYYGLNAAAWDGTRNKLWVCAEHSKVLLVNTTDGSSTFMFTAADQCTDGLAYDGTDDTLWTSGDVHTNVYHYKSNGTLIEIKSVVGKLGGYGNSGIAVGGSKLYLANNGGSQIYVLPKDFSTSTLFATFPERLEDMECDDVTFASQGVGAIWSQDAYDRTINAYAIEKGQCGFGGLPPVCQEVNQTVYITNQTPITLTCKDVFPHPVDHVNLSYRYRFNESCENLSDSKWTSWLTLSNNGSEIDPYLLNKTIYFPEDSCHELEYYCMDALGNKEHTKSEVDIVDTQAPNIFADVSGPQYYNTTEKNLYIDGVTVINVDATDPEPHPVDDVTCSWSYTVNGNGPYHVVNGTAVQGVAKGVKAPFVVHFPEESKHVLTIQCEDALHNSNTTQYTYLVDKTPPSISKSFDGPQYPGDKDQSGYAHWINNKTNIILTVEDTGPHKSGIKETKYRVTLLGSDKYCNNVELCQAAQGTGNWTGYTAPFKIENESCHLIEYYSVDNVEKKQEKKQCVFVDNTAPVPNKTVGEPKTLWDGKDSTYYPWIKGKCWNGRNDSIDCWKVTTMTPIILGCDDQLPHPVGHSNVWFQVDFDGEDKTKDYCEYVHGNFNSTDNGYCLIAEQQAPVTFYFNEESEHNLKYYCTDALGNRGPVDDEKFKVEGTSFSIKLNKKWNLISVPFVMLDGSIEEAFKNVASTVESVWTYDPEHEICNDPSDWCVYTPGAAPDTLREMTPGWGYWVKSYNDSVLVIGGSLFSPAKTPPDKSVVKGWNLIGYYGTEGQLSYDRPVGAGKPAVCALGSLVNTMLGHPRWSSLVSYWEQYNPNLWIYLGEYDNMDPGAGYWLEMDESDIYTYSTTCGGYYGY